MNSSKLLKVSIAVIVAALVVMIIPFFVYAQDEKEGFDHSIYGGVLRKYVVESLVNY